MIALSLGEVASIVGGRLVDADPSTQVTGSVEFDSRKVGPGGLFVAFAGEHHDGHDYVVAARDAGAVAALVTRSVAGPRIEVSDALDALAALAGAVVRRLSDTVVIAVTGSSGKTSTKDLIAHVLAGVGETVAPAGSFNNELGLPYTVLRSGSATRFLVAEMGARGVGHIRHLTTIAPPRIGVVLNVGSAHLGEFGSREAIAQAKGELVEALPAGQDGGVAVLNADDPLVAAMSSRTRARLVTFGTAPDADVRGSDISADHLGRPAFNLHAAGRTSRVQLRLVGEHHVSNALATAAVAIECGMDGEAVGRALAAATPSSPWRMEVSERPDGVVVINDAYNANPESMRAALKTLVTVSRSRGTRSFAVLGTMAELGPSGQAEHDALGRLAVRLGVSRVVAVGDPARAIAQGAALEGSWDGESSWVPDTTAALSLVRNELRPGDVVLVKASRAAGLERVAMALAASTAGQDETGADEAGGRRA